ncbi:MAG: hypothetical protein ACI31W_01275 [Lactococcus sp.]
MHPIVILGSLVGLAFSMLYLIATLKGQVQPNKVTWLIWALAPLISAVAAFSAGVTWAVLPVFVSGLGPLLIFLASFFNKDAYWEMGKIDYLCGALALLALIAWALTKDANVAIILSLGTDILAAIPTLNKGWKYPQTENGWLYLGSVLSSLASFTEVQNWSLTEVAFPIYLIILGLSFCLIFELRKAQLKSHHSATIRKK